MTTYKDLKLIDSNWIDERIKGYKEYLKSLPKTEENVDDFKVHRAIISEYQILKLQLIDATPILKESFETGIQAINYDERKGFSVNKNLFEQLLNTEVKIIK